VLGTAEEVVPADASGAVVDLLASLGGLEAIGPDDEPNPFLVADPQREDDIVDLARKHLADDLATDAFAAAVAAEMPEEESEAGAPGVAPEAAKAPARPKRARKPPIE
jgi:hypothetical protein